MDVASKVDLSQVLTDAGSLPAEERAFRIVEAILKSREIDDIDTFLNPPAIDDDFFSEVSALFGDELSVAVELVSDTSEKGGGNKSIVIHGDYDVDGVSASAVLWEAVYYDLGFKNALPFIPHRVNNGYGLSKSSIDDILSQLAEKGLEPGLLITVDCGITSKDAVDYAKSKGFRVIVTDHHTLPENENDLPGADATLHSYKLCGAGIAWVLAGALRKKLSLGGSSFDAAGGVDLVALATLADIQELTDFNRALVVEGLKRLTSTNRPGLQALYDVAGILGKPIGVYEVGWVIAPRLNATGRLQHALDALRLLVVKSRERAYELANALNSLNLQRQRMTKEAVDEAIEVVNATWNRDSAIVVASARWHEGIIGLIAGRLVQEFNAPAIAISIGEEIAKGSARSVEGVNIVELLRSKSELFENMGGHAGAAGFSIKSESVDKLKEALSGVSLKEFGDKTSDVVKVDAELDLSYISWELYELLAKLEPFGMGNPRPRFFARWVKLLGKRVVGKTKEHLALTFENGLRGIGFGLAKAAEGLKESVDIVYTVDKDDYRGGHSVQIKVERIG